MPTSLRASWLTDRLVARARAQRLPGGEGDVVRDEPDRTVREADVDAVAVITACGDVGHRDAGIAAIVTVVVGRGRVVVQTVFREIAEVLKAAIADDARGGVVVGIATPRSSHDEGRRVRLVEGRPGLRRVRTPARVRTVRITDRWEQVDHRRLVSIA